MEILAEIGHALWIAFAMFWEILWPLILGFGLSGVVQAVVSKGEMSKLLPDDSPKTLALATGLGAASSSCSYAAVALARSIFRRGANFTAAMAFELASTNLVAELSIILIVLMGWQFALAEFAGGPLMVAIVAVLFRLFLSRKLVKQAKEQADKGIKGAMEGHAEMDMSVEGRSFWQRISSPEAITATSHYFVMDWAMVWKDIAGGLLIAGAISAWVPQNFWKTLFLPQILWLESDRFRRRHFLFGNGRGCVDHRVCISNSRISSARAKAQVVEASISFNYTTVLNIIFLMVAGFLVIRFLKTGGPKMLAHMD